MNLNTHQKVEASHLQRDAYVYIRQSSMRQVLQNRESTRRQYDFRGQAVALGWRLEQVKVIDSDQGQSGRFKEGRDGFQELVAAVSLGHAGIVMGLEVSRLARNNADWHNLLELCAFSGTLILDQDGLYDANLFNDRLLLGLKGAMSEAELHVLKSRLQGGILNKARRGELQVALPTGLVYDPRGRVVLNPDQQVRQVFVHFFESFKRIGSALGVVKAFRKELIKFPTRCRKGPRKGQLVWGELTHSQALKVLHQPRYAGAFCYGRTRTRRAPDGRRVHETLPRDRWSVLIKEAHQGYINWNQYEGNLRRLRENARAYGKERRRSPAGQGPALLQGLAICARCGRRMTVNYHSRAKRLIPHYLCQREGIEQGHKPCQRIPGEKIDQAVSDLLLKTLNRHNLNLTVQVHEEIQRRKEEADRLRHEQVQRARYEADLAQRRYLQVDPNNRLVADVLEAEWNRGLEELTEAQRQYEEQRKRDQETLGEAAKKQIVALTRQFPKIWNDPQTLHRDRKRVLRLIIEDVTLLKDEAISLHVRFKGGATRTLDLPAPLGAAQLRKTDPQVVKQIDALLEQHTEAEAAEILNQHGLRSAIGLSFDRLKVKRIRNAYALKSRYHRLREKGLLTHREVAQLIGIDPTQINHWRKRGLLQAERANDKNDYLFGRPDAQTLEQIRKRTRSKKPERSHCLSHT